MHGSFVYLLKRGNARKTKFNFNYFARVKVSVKVIKKNYIVKHE